MPVVPSVHPVTTRFDGGGGGAAVNETCPGHRDPRYDTLCRQQRLTLSFCLEFLLEDRRGGGCQSLESMDDGVEDTEKVLAGAAHRHAAQHRHGHAFEVLAANQLLQSFLPRAGCASGIASLVDTMPLPTGFNDTDDDEDGCGLAPEGHDACLSFFSLAAETSVVRLLDRTHAALYDMPSSDLPTMLRIGDELFRQLQQWYRLLPTNIRPPLDRGTSPQMKHPRVQVLAVHHHAAQVRIFRPMLLAAAQHACRGSQTQPPAAEPPTRIWAGCVACVERLRCALLMPCPTSPPGPPRTVRLRAGVYKNAVVSSLKRKRALLYVPSEGFARHSPSYASLTAWTTTVLFCRPRPPSGGHLTSRLSGRASKRRDAIFADNLTRR